MDCLATGKCAVADGGDSDIHRRKPPWHLAPTQHSDWGVGGGARTRPSPCRPRILAAGVAVAERKHAITSLNAATRISNNLIYDLADRFRHQTGVPAALVKDILNRAQKLQDELVSSGQSSPELIHSQASALSETSMTLMTIGDRAGALATADRARQILEALLTKEPTNASLQLDLGVVCQRRRCVGGRREAS